MLQDDFRCGIHDRMRERGFPGCDVFDCFGAGQQVVQVTFGGRDWRADPSTATQVFDAFPVMRQLHELLWHLTEAQALVPAGALRDDVDRLKSTVSALAQGSPDDVVAVDVAALRREAGAALSRVSDVARAGLRRTGRDRRGADLVEANLRGADLSGVSLRGALLLGADLRGADLTRADLLGADLRAADVRGANLADSLFLTQPQVQAARGDASTRLPAHLVRPRHWSG